MVGRSDRRDPVRGRQLREVQVRTDGLVFRCSSPADDEALRAFLEAAGLPAADVETGRQEYVLALDGEHVVGTVGLEVGGEDALLRSLAVAPDHQGRGIASELHDRALALARARRVRTLYLLTTTAEGFAARRGFERVARDELPPAILSLAQLRALCPATAICMRRTIE
jgi:N-acetylglutamate synthase-like GNAT family acetyltransferase